MDSNDVPVLVYQNKCNEELFGRNNELKGYYIHFITLLGSKERAKRIVKFGNLNDKPLIYFYRNAGLAEFLDSNPTLANLTIIKSDPNSEEAAFLLEDFHNEAEGQLLNFVLYICACVKLLAAMLKGRNIKSAKRIKRLDIDPEYIVEALKSEKIHSKIKAYLLNFYQACYLDVNPFQKISCYSNRCILYLI